MEQDDNEFSEDLETEEFCNAKLSTKMRYNLFTNYMWKAVVKDKRCLFLSVNNDAHEFMKVFNLKTNDVCILDSKKGEKVETKKHTKPGNKGSRIDNDNLASIVHADFGRYLASVGHTKASDIFTADLKHFRMKCQRESKAASCGVFAMRHM
nr:hypothetical protein [Tanacetum cinerariifolium]